MNLLRALATVSGMTLLSRILGFVRDFVIARAFGAGIATDAFFVAFRLPNLLRRMFAEGAFSQAFVPILAEYKNRLGPEDTHRLVNRVATALGLAVTAVTALGILAAPLIIAVSAPGFAAEPDKFALTVELTRITFPYILFMSLVALAGGVLNTWSRFASARRRRTEHVEPFRDSRLHAGAAEPLVHRDGAVRRTPFPSAGDCARVGGVHRGRAAARASAASAVAHRLAAAI